jgi:hypothetical protein
MEMARSTVYDEPIRMADDTAIVAAMARICDEFEHYGWRRVRAALRQQGMLVNHKKVRRLMREHDLQPRMRRRFTTTTDSDHDQPIFRAKDFGHYRAVGSSATLRGKLLCAFGNFSAQGSAPRTGGTCREDPGLSDALVVGNVAVACRKDEFYKRGDGRKSCARLNRRIARQNYGG